VGIDPINVGDLEALAREKLPGVTFDYYASGALDETTLRENVLAFQRIRVHYRVLAGIRARELATTVLGTPVSLPVLVAPTAFHKMAHPEGESATARGAAAAGTVMILSSLSNTGVEEVARASGGPLWFQLYVYRDRGATEALVRRAEAAGAKAIVLTVDAPILGRRERDVRNGFCLPEGLSVENMSAAGYGAVAQRLRESGLAAYVAELLEPALTWKDLGWLGGLTRLPVVVKGIVRADDARRAVDHGARAVVVSNHGGRQLAGAPPTIEVLARIADAVGSRAEIYLDGGVRRGGDALKAIALGARAVLVGRPVLWGLAYDGDRGVRLVLDILRRELDEAMALAGCGTVADITRDLVDPDALGSDR
jgi:4-hydroxymandelate oxidase